MKAVVRGSADDPAAIPIQREAIEHRLVREGFSLRDLRGEVEQGYVVEPARGLFAWVRRRDRRGVQSVAVGLACLSLIATAETGLFVLGVAGACLAAGVWHTGRLDSPDPVTKRFETTREGLTERETLRYLTMSNEIASMEQEERQEQARRLRQSAGSQTGGGRTGGSTRSPPSGKPQGQGGRSGSAADLSHGGRGGR